MKKYTVSNEVKRRLSTVANSFKIVVSYSICVVTAMLYALFVDGTSGVLLTAFLILVPVISFMLMMVSKNNVSIRISSNDTLYKKNSPVDVIIHIDKKNIIPIPFINLKVGYSPHLCSKDIYSTDDFPQIRTSMAFEKSLKCDLNFIAKVSGSCKVFIYEAYMYDYLGFFRVKLKDLVADTEIHIIPEVKEIQSSQMLFNAICNSVITNDEDEENSSNDNFSIGSTLGYLHREYVVGDSPKKIDWKLSCKKDTLMVRLDEPSPQSKPCIILDMSIDDTSSNGLSSVINFEKLVESSLALASMCVRGSIECEYILCNCGRYKSYVLTSVDDVYNLAVTISHNSHDGKHSLPNEICNLKSSDSLYILFTDFFKSDLKTQIATLKNRGICIETILSPRYKGMYSQPNVWVVNDDLSILQSNY